MPRILLTYTVLASYLLTSPISTLSSAFSPCFASSLSVSGHQFLCTNLSCLAILGGRHLRNPSTLEPRTLLLSPPHPATLTPPSNNQKHASTPETASSTDITVPKRVSSSLSSPSGSSLFPSSGSHLLAMGRLLIGRLLSLEVCLGLRIRYCG